MKSLTRVPPAGRLAIRVAAVPANHVYIRHIREDPSDVVHLPDPPPQVPDATPGQWWPPAALDPAWIRGNADRFDVLHLHFGFDAVPPETLEEVVRALGDAEKPFVYTVHDLRNPHHADRAAHDAHLDVLIPSADGLITLTAGAARDVDARWGRRTAVLPHPHVLPIARLGIAPRRDRKRFVIGLHLKSLRASMDPVPIIRAIVPTLTQLPGSTLVIDAHRDIADPGGPRHDPEVMAVVRDAARHPQVRVHVHDCYSDEELWRYLGGLDVSVLPYRFGTHSGWLEACHDLGTAVLAPDCGHLHEQRPCLAYRTGDSESVVTAMHLAYVRRPRWQATRAERLAERGEIARAHRALYEEALGR